MQEWLPIIAVAIAAGSLVYSIYSTRKKRDWKLGDQNAKDLKNEFLRLEGAFGKLAEDFVTVQREIPAEEQKARSKIWKELRKLSKEMADKESTYRDRFLERREWEKVEKLKNQQLQDWKRQNEKLEEAWAEILRNLRSNGTRAR